VKNASTRARRSKTALAADVIQRSYGPGRGDILGKIAADLEQALEQRARAGGHGRTSARPVAAGDGWAIHDVLCTFGPHDRPFEEQHTGVCIAMVVAGSFTCRAGAGSELLTPGSLLLGNTGQCFECGHRHGAGDRCLSVHYKPAWFEWLTADAGLGSRDLNFRRVRVPPLRALSPLIAQACAAATAAGTATQPAWDELVVQLAAATLQATQEGMRHLSTPKPTPAALSRVAQIVRMIDGSPDSCHTLSGLARAACMSEFHFLRTFQRVTGVTPHQYVLRARLRAAALRLADDTAKIVEIALDSGFDDISNFNHAFRAEFGVSPRGWRAGARSRGHNA
jgi:AraC-like DNA-binding protein